MVRPSGVEPDRVGNLPIERYKCSVSPRDKRLVPTLGIEPRILRYKGSVIPLNYAGIINPIEQVVSPEHLLCNPD